MADQEKLTIEITTGHCLGGEGNDVYPGQVLEAPLDLSIAEARKKVRMGYARIVPNAPKPLDTVGSSEAQLRERMVAQYQSKELDALLLAPIRGISPREDADESTPRVNVTIAGGAKKKNPHSDVPNARTAVFSIPPCPPSKQATILATSTRYGLEDFLHYARRFGWEHLGTAQASPESTFHQLLFRRVE